MSDEDDGALLARKLQRFEMYFGHQRAGCVDDLQRARFGFVSNRRWHAVRAENQYGAVRHILDGLHENGAAAAQLLDHVGVVHDLMVHVDRRTVSFQRQLHDVDRADHTRAEAARPHSQQNFCICFGLHRHPNV